MSQELDTDTEQRLRKYLWLNHGHQGQYGDDGEMQCGACHPLWDYKRSPLAEVIRQAIKANGEVNIAALIAHQKASSSVSAQAVTGEEATRTTALELLEHIQRGHAQFSGERYIECSCGTTFWLPLPLSAGSHTENQP